MGSLYKVCAVWVEVILVIWLDKFTCLLFKNMTLKDGKIEICDKPILGLKSSPEKQVSPWNWNQCCSSLSIISKFEDVHYIVQPVSL